MGPRHVSRPLGRFARAGLAALGALTLLAAPAAAQTWRGAQGDFAESADELTSRHANALYAERLATFHALWAQADEDARERAAKLVEGRLGSGAPADAWPDLGTLSAAARVLDGAAPADVGQGTLAALVDALDVQLLPGVLELTDDERGQQVRARVYPADPHRATLARRACDVSLYWIAPDGTETRARTQPVEPPAFAVPGFDMYLRAPTAQPGPWSIVLEARAHDRPDELVRGLPIPVELAASFHEPFLDAHAALRDGPYDGRHLHLEDLRRLLGWGARFATGDAPTKVLAHLLATVGGGEPPALDLRAVLLPEDAPFYERVRSWRYEPRSEPRIVLVVPAPDRVGPESAFFGPAGDAWRAVADRHGIELWSVAHAASSGPDLATIVAQARAARPDLEVGLLLRGSAVAQAMFDRLRGGAPDPDFVVVSSGAVDPDAELFGAPTLVLRAPADRAHRSSPFLAELELPGAVADWLAERRSGEEPK